MPHSLADTQAAFAAALGDPDLPVPANLVGPRRGRAVRRFAIYRNNIAVSLIDALQARFPVTAKLVGEEFFRAMARAYVREQKPRTPVLICYGDGFPAFIASFQPAKEIPYLADVAAIEAAWTETYHAADAEPLDPSKLGGMDELTLAAARVSLLPSVRLLRSEYPAGSIWLGHQGEHVVPPREWIGEQVMLVRPDTEVRLRLLGAGQFVFAKSLAVGSAIETAAGHALIADAAFDVGSALVVLLQAGAVAKIEVDSDRSAV